jgi:hypothetical protein
LIGGIEEWGSLLDDEATADGIPVINNKTVARAMLTIARERRLNTEPVGWAFRVIEFMFNF